MTTTDFADKYRLKVRRDADGTEIIPGRPGSSHIYEYGEDELRVMFLPYKSIHDPARPRLWHSLCREAIALGMVLRQNGDAEGCLSFDPSDQGQARLAIRIAG